MCCPFAVINALYIVKSAGHPVVYLVRTGDVALVVLTLAGQIKSATTLDLFLPTSVDRQAILRGHGGATRRPELTTR